MLNLRSFPTSYDWNFTIISDVISDIELSDLRLCLKSVNGIDNSNIEILPLDFEECYLEITFANFSDFKEAKILNKLYKNNFNIFIELLNKNDNSTNVGFMYMNGLIISSKGNFKLNEIKELTADEIVLTIKFQKRQYVDVEKYNNCKVLYTNNEIYDTINI